MKAILSKISFFTLILLLSVNLSAQDFQGKAYYFSKSKMELGAWGARMSEAQKKQIAERLKNRLEKTYVLNFNKEESLFDEEEKLDAWSGATDSWGKNFAPGKSYKNIKDKALVQSQEFYGKKFLVKDELLAVEWKMGTESKQIGQYTCFKATAVIPTTQLTWYNFSWGDLRRAEQKQEGAENTESNEPDIQLTQIEAWFTPQIPVGHGPGEYWGLPGLILEVSAGNTTMLCSKIVMNPEEKVKIEAPDKGKITTKSEYQATVLGKMREMRDNRGRRRSR